MKNYQAEADQLQNEAFHLTLSGERDTPAYRNVMYVASEELAHHLEQYDNAVVSLEPERKTLQTLKVRKERLETRLRGVSGVITRLSGTQERTKNVLGRIENSIERLNGEYWEKFEELTMPHIIAKRARIYVEGRRLHPMAFTAGR
jgi:chromosome segregation ATPase